MLMQAKEREFFIDSLLVGEAGDKQHLPCAVYSRVQGPGFRVQGEGCRV